MTKQIEVGTRVFVVELDERADEPVIVEAEVTESQEEWRRAEGTLLVTYATPLGPAHADDYVLFPEEVFLSADAAIVAQIAIHERRIRQLEQLRHRNGAVEVSR